MPSRTSRRLSVPPSRATDPLALALDIGSSSVRASIWDANGSLVTGTARRLAYRWRLRPDGAVRLPVAVLDRHVDTLLDAISRSAPLLPRVRTGAVSAFFHSFVEPDGGASTGDVVSWADTTAAEARQRLASVVDPDAAWQRTGAPLHASYWPVRLRHALDSRGDGGQGPRRWSDYPALLLERLTGVRAMGQSMASGTGLYDRAAGAWDARLLAALGLEPAQLPPLVDDLTVLGPLAGAARTRWPALAHLDWYPAWGDGACGNVGLACVGRRRAALMVGTSSAMRLLLSDPAPAVRTGLFAFRFGYRHALLGGQLSEGGGVLAWLARLTGRTLVDLDRAAAARPGPSPLSALPYLAGERGPGYHAGATGAIVGLTAQTDAVDLYRTLVEAIALRLAIIDRLLAGRLAGQVPPDVTVSGGAAASSRIWPQVLADVLGREVGLASTAEASSRGAALAAIHGRRALDGETGAGDPEVSRIEPDLERHARYREASARQERLYEQLVG